MHSGRSRLCVPTAALGRGLAIDAQTIEQVTENTSRSKVDRLREITMTGGRGRGLPLGIGSA